MSDLLPEDTITFFEHLRDSQRQLDMDGCEVGVSRQAVDEALAEIERLRAELKQAQHRSFQDGRISYKGFNYGVGSQWGIDSLRRAIEGNGHG